MDLKTMTLEALKGLAYDQMVELQRLQQNLQILNQEITSRQLEKAQAEKQEEPKPTE